ncbi:hypothetical protein ACA910_004053 [Epithemia clementina (nom. ined.)]
MAADLVHPTARQDLRGNVNGEAQPQVHQRQHRGRQRQQHRESNSTDTNRPSPGPGTYEEISEKLLSLNESVLAPPGRPHRARHSDRAPSLQNRALRSPSFSSIRSKSPSSTHLSADEILKKTYDREVREARESSSKHKSNKSNSNKGDDSSTKATVATQQQQHQPPIQQPRRNAASSGKRQRIFVRTASLSCLGMAEWSDSEDDDLLFATSGVDATTTRTTTTIATTSSQSDVNAGGLSSSRLSAIVAVFSTPTRPNLQRSRSGSFVEGTSTSGRGATNVREKAAEVQRGIEASFSGSSADSSVISQLLQSATAECSSTAANSVDVADDGDKRGQEGTTKDVGTIDNSGGGGNSSSDGGDLDNHENIEGPSQPPSPPQIRSKRNPSHFFLDDDSSLLPFLSVLKQKNSDHGKIEEDLSKVSVPSPRKVPSILQVSSIFTTSLLTQEATMSPKASKSSKINETSKKKHKKDKKSKKTNSSSHSVGLNMALNAKMDHENTSMEEKYQSRPSSAERRELMKKSKSSSHIADEKEDTTGKDEEPIAIQTRTGDGEKSKVSKESNGLPQIGDRPSERGIKEIAGPFLSPVISRDGGKKALKKATSSSQRTFEEDVNQKEDKEPNVCVRKFSDGSKGKGVSTIGEEKDESESSNQDDTDLSVAHRVSNNECKRRAVKKSNSSYKIGEDKDASESSDQDDAELRVASSLPNKDARREALKKSSSFSHLGGEKKKKRKQDREGAVEKKKTVSSKIVEVQADVEKVAESRDDGPITEKPKSMRVGNQVEGVKKTGHTQNTASGRNAAEAVKEAGKKTPKSDEPRANEVREDADHVNKKKKKKKSATTQQIQAFRDAERSIVSFPDQLEGSRDREDRRTAISQEKSGHASLRRFIDEADSAPSKLPKNPPSSASVPVLSGELHKQVESPSKRKKGDDLWGEIQQLLEKHRVDQSVGDHGDKCTMSAGHGGKSKKTKSTEHLDLQTTAKNSVRNSPPGSNHSQVGGSHHSEKSGHRKHQNDHGSDGHQNAEQRVHLTGLIDGKGKPRKQRPRSESVPRRRTTSGHGKPLKGTKHDLVETSPTQNSIRIAKHAEEPGSWPKMRKEKVEPKTIPPAPLHL